MISELVTADIGGTHARFALAQIEDGRVLRLGEALAAAPGVVSALLDGA